MTPRVLYVDHTAQASGGEIALLRLLSALGGSVRPLVVLGEHGPLEAELAALDIEVLVLPLPGETRDLRKDRLANPLVALGRIRAVVGYALVLRRLIRERRIDLVHTNSLKAGFYGCLAARLAGTPSVWHLRDRVAGDYLPRAAVLVTRLATALLPTVVLCNSAATRDTLPPRLFALLGRRSARAPEPIGDPLDADGVAVASRPDEPEHFRVAMVGRFSPWKGQRVAIRAFAAAGLGPSARLVLMGSAMFGEAEYERAIHDEIAALGLRDTVELSGFVDDVLGALVDVDVLVHASTIPEPFGQVVIEGLAAGVPVVATRAGGPGEILTDRVDGLLYDAGDEAALAALLRELHDDPRLRRSLADNGRKRVADFSPGAISAAVLRLYDQVRRTPPRKDGTS
jgi:glycosyltransferase involved in cell wall biosynthesis